MCQTIQAIHHTINNAVLITESELSSPESPDLFNARQKLANSAKYSSAHGTCLKMQTQDNDVFLS